MVGYCFDRDLGKKGGFWGFWGTFTRRGPEAGSTVGFSVPIDPWVDNRPNRVWGDNIHCQACHAMPVQQ